MSKNIIIGQRYRIVEKLDKSHNEYLIEDLQNNLKRLFTVNFKCTLYFLLFKQKLN